MLTLRRETLATPIGAIILLTTPEDRLCLLDWEDCEDRLQLLLRRRFGGRTVRQAPIPGTARPGAAARSLARYFEGDRQAIDTLALDPGGTAFQRSVWEALRAIPAGTTATYGAVARRLGRPRAMRAVGAANGANPISIVIPCHRLVGHDGALTGYAGGLDRKRWLLRHEGLGDGLDAGPDTAPDAPPPR